MNSQPNQSICPGCSHAGEIRFKNVKDSWGLSESEYDFARCTHCRSLFISPPPTASEIADSYKHQDYYTHLAPAPQAKGPPPTMRKLKERLFRVGYDYENNDRCSIALRISAKMPPVRRRSGTFMRFLEHKKNGKLLDFGCGDGGFLLEARRWGWECFGLEPDPNAGCHRLNCEGICILAGGLDSLETSGLKFDAIVLHHVIEHVIDVNDCLRRLAKTLNPGGQLVSISPNPNSLGLAAMANWWPALDAPRHAFIPSLQFLRSCCKEADLSPSLFTIHRNLPNYCMWGLKNKERAGIAVQPFTAAIGLLTIAAGALELLGAPKGEEVVLIARKSATR